MSTEKIENNTRDKVIKWKSYDWQSAELGKILHTKQEIIESIKIIPESSKKVFDIWISPKIEQLSCDISCLYGINFIDIDELLVSNDFEHLKKICLNNLDSNTFVFSMFTRDQLENILSHEHYQRYLRLLDLDNVFYVNILNSVEEEIIRYCKGGSKKKKFTSNEWYFRNMIESEISLFLHDFLHNEEYRKKLSGFNNLEKLKYIFSHEIEFDEKVQDFVEKMIKMLELQHPSFKLSSKDEKKQWIIDIYDFELTCEVPNWTHYNGVFIDWDGCLYDNYWLKFNDAVLKMIENYEEEWKAIHIRTWGNLESKQKILDAAGIPYKIESKAQYKWSTVDVILDNDSADVVYANTKIKAKQHIVI